MRLTCECRSMYVCCIENSAGVLQLFLIIVYFQVTTFFTLLIYHPAQSHQIIDISIIAKTGVVIQSCCLRIAIRHDRRHTKRGLYPAMG